MIGWRGKPRISEKMAVSNTADLFFSLWNTFLFLGIGVGIVVFAVMAFLLFKYRARASTPEPEDVPVLGRLPLHRGHARTLIVSVTLSTIILSVLIFGTFSAIDQISYVPAVCNAPGAYTLPTGPCMLVNAVGHRFSWVFYYTNGTSHDFAGHPNLIVPTGKIVVMNVTSVDVTHNLTLIDYKIKTDAVAGRANVIWFNATETRTSRIQCFEYCGTLHYTMYSNIVAMQPPDFLAWYVANHAQNNA